MLQSMRLPGVGHNLLTEHNNNKFGNSLVVLWLWFYTFTSGGTGLILAYKLRGPAKKAKQNKTNKNPSKLNRHM